MPTRARAAGATVGRALLNIAAVGGLVCLVLVALAVVFHVSLIMFKTDSMSPTIPAGSLAVVRETPAASVSVGDVVTVERPSALPVTHRVTTISPGPSPEQRVLTLRGDANRHDDPFPYTVTTVRTVLASAPGLAYVIVWFSNPWVLGALTLSASALVTWAFWPRHTQPSNSSISKSGAHPRNSEQQSTSASGS